MNDYSMLFLAGRTIEHAVKDAIKARYSVVVTANITGGNGHGPRMEDSGLGVVLADLQTYGKGTRAGWIEVKGKSRANHWYTWNRDEHGIDTDKWREYEKLQKETRLTVYLLICEAQSGDLLMQDLDTLNSKAGSPRYGKIYEKEVVTFDRAAFAHVGSINIPVDDLRQMSVTIDWEKFETFVTQPMLIEDE